MSRSLKATRRRFSVDRLYPSALGFCTIDVKHFKCSYRRLHANLTVYSVAVSRRFLHERHEQTKQDLKGLEETVVS